MQMECGQKCEVYSRIVGYFRPIANWNIGKKEEFKERVEYEREKALNNEFVKGCECTL
jgi:ribonucleoside-triphosphate reductase